MPSSFTTRNVGIKPPWNSIVNTTRNMITLRPSTSLRAKPYAINAVMNILMIVPINVVPIDTAIALNIVFVEKMNR
ncbi:hypothetical protein D3C85_1310100 [compost metagenome]